MTITPTQSLVAQMEEGQQQQDEDEPDVHPQAHQDVGPQQRLETPHAQGRLLLAVRLVTLAAAGTPLKQPAERV